MISVYVGDDRIDEVVLGGTGDLAERWGVTTQRVRQLAALDGFPAQLGTINGNPVYDVAECDAWRTEPSRGRGRPRLSAEQIDAAASRMSWRDVDGPEGFKARLLEIGPGWFFFLQPQGSVYWLCGGAVRGEPPESIELDEQKRNGTEKLCALLGLSWEEIEAKPAESADWQLKCMERLGPNMKAKLRGSSVEEIAEWRAQAHTLEPGEVLRERLTGEDPFAGRN